jgi:hypothetical protein
MTCVFAHDGHCGTQELLGVGVRCWVLHPRNGIRPVAEGYAGPSPAEITRERGLICRSLLMELCDDGKQTVKVTKLWKKNCPVMFPEENPESKHLDDYVIPPAAPDTYVTWLSMYLERMKDDD